jgi:hypothetical protein
VACTPGQEHMASSLETGRQEPLAIQRGAGLSSGSIRSTWVQAAQAQAQAQPAQTAIHQQLRSGSRTGGFSVGTNSGTHLHSSWVQDTAMRSDIDPLAGHLLDAAHSGHANRHLLHPVTPTYSMFAWRTTEATQLYRYSGRLNSKACHPWTVCLQWLAC